MDTIWNLVLKRVSKFVIPDPEFRDTLLVPKITKCGDLLYSDSQLVLNLHLPPRKIELYLNELYIFFNVVKPWPVMGEYRELLKIVPIKQDEDDENITVDFHKPEYHSLSELHPRLLKFKIFTVDGTLIEQFDENYIMYMNLQFCFN